MSKIIEGTLYDISERLRKALYPEQLPVCENSLHPLLSLQNK